jgi:hypothetical protein
LTVLVLVNFGTAISPENQNRTLAELAARCAGTGPRNRGQVAEVATKLQVGAFALVQALTGQYVS